MRVMHVITGLSVGGAEHMLCKLVGAMDAATIESRVVSLLSGGPFAGRIRDQGIEVVELGMSRSWPSPAGILALRKLIVEFRPDVVHTWMYHADLIGGIAARLAGVNRLAWSIRQSNFMPGKSNRRTMRVVRWCARLSRYVPEKIVSCSSAAAEYHVSIGYDEGKICIIPNGFDTQVSIDRARARASLVEELGVAEDAELIGHVARFDPQKDHRSFINAAIEISAARERVHFVCCGDGINPENATLSRWISDANLQDRFHLLDRRDDINEVAAAMDVFVSSSAYGEGFPNVLGEAMSQRVPCVTTDVGDSALVVGDAGQVVQPADPIALAHACIAILDLDADRRSQIGELARRRIVENFSIERVGVRFEEFYRKLAA